MLKKLLFLFLVAAGYPVAAQKLAHSDLLMFSMTAGADSIWHAGSPRFLTVFNRQGYNNQPNFISDNDLYLTVQRPADSTQTEIYSLNLASRTFTQVTQTSTSEYSPTLMFGGQRFSVVEVDMNGIQRLVSYPFDRSDNGRVEFSQITGVGYHCWLRDTLAALFIVGQTEQDPHILYVAGTRNQKLQRITANPGRCLLPLAGGKLAYVQKATEQTWYLKIYDPKNQSSAILTKMPVGVEDFALLPNGTYLCGKGAKLWQYQPGRQTNWLEIADLSAFGVKNITRMTVSRQGNLAVVVN